jgi:hypothetical protein
MCRTIRIGPESIEGILNVLASSTLAVTVFSVSAYGSATITPRATKLLMDDNTSKNVVGTFVGSFPFGLVGIIALSTGLYGSQGRAMLVATIGLIALIAVTILRGIDYLARFGRLGETIEGVENATWTAMEMRLAHSYFGARPYDGGECGVPEAAGPSSPMPSAMFSMSMCLRFRTAQNPRIVRSSWWHCRECSPIRRDQSPWWWDRGTAIWLSGRWRGSRGGSWGCQA